MYMKVKNNIINIILSFILVIILSYSFNNNLIFIYCIYNSLFFIFKNIFNIDYKELFLKNKSNKLIFNKCFFNVLNINILLNIFIFGIIYILINIMNKILVINNINFLLYTSISLLGYSLIKILTNYLSIYKLNINKYLYRLYNIITFIISLISIFIFKNIKLLIISNLISFIILFIFITYKYKIKIGLNNKKYNKEIVSLYNKSSNNIIVNMLKNSYLYISIILMLYTLIFKYHYEYNYIVKYLNILYLYSFYIIYLLIKIIENKLKIKKELYEDKIMFVMNKILPISILFFVLSKYIYFILFNNTKGYDILMFASINILFIYLLEFTLEYISVKSKKRTLIIGLIIKLLLTIPLINACLRLGFNLIYADILTNLIIFIIMIIYNMIIVKNKYNINFINLFDHILKIIYKNIIYLLFLSIISLFLKLEVTLFDSILIISIYLIIVYILNKSNRLLRKYLLKSKK